jgi:hypothetical protein
VVGTEERVNTVLPVADRGTACFPRHPGCTDFTLAADQSYAGILAACRDSRNGVVERHEVELAATRRTAIYR